MANIRTLQRVIEDRDYTVFKIVEAQMVGSETREAYWRRQFELTQAEIAALCAELGVPVPNRVQLPLFVFLDNRVTPVTFE